MYRPSGLQGGRTCVRRPAVPDRGGQAEPELPGPQDGLQETHHRCADCDRELRKLHGSYAEGVVVCKEDGASEVCKEGCVVTTSGMVAAFGKM